MMDDSADFKVLPLDLEDLFEDYNNVKEEEEDPISRRKLLSMVFNYCENLFDPDNLFVAQLVNQVDPVTLFRLIKAADHFKNKSLMNLTCRTLVNKVKAIISGENIIKLNSDQTFPVKRVKRVHSSDAISPVVSRRVYAQNINSLLRSHGKETFIMQSDFVDVQFSPFVACELRFIDERISVFKSCVKELMDSSKSLKSSKFMASSDFRKLWKSTERLEMLINKDRCIADLLDPCVMRRLVQILKIIDREIIESECITILSRARFDKCHDDIKEEVLSHFVKLMDFNHYPQFVDEVVIALTRLAYANPDYVQYIVKIGALNAALKICGIQRGPVSGANYTIYEVAKFLVAVCRGENLSREKFSYNQVKVTLTISDNLFQQKFKSTCHIERTCYALSYLTFEREVPIEGEAFSRLIRLIYHDDYSVAGSALGVVGNIARWGNHKQIQYMAEDSELLQNLGQRWLHCKFMMFKKEACQIISNIAALSETISAALGERFRQNMQIARLIGPLCKLLQGDESDLKVEAACSLFNSIYGGTYVETIDKNDKDTLMAT